MADIVKSVAGQVEATEISGQVEESEVAGAETVIYFINHMGHFLQIAGWLLGGNPIITVYFLQEIATEYKSRWGTFGEAT